MVAGPAGGRGVGVRLAEHLAGARPMVRGEHGIGEAARRVRVHASPVLRQVAADGPGGGPPLGASWPGTYQVRPDGLVRYAIALGCAPVVVFTDDDCRAALASQLRHQLEGSLLRFLVHGRGRFVEHDQVEELLGKHGLVVPDQLVVDDVEELELAVAVAPGDRVPFDNLNGKGGEAPDLLRPLMLERGRRHDQDVLDVSQALQQSGRDNRLDGFSEAHVVGEASAEPGPGEVRVTMAATGVCGTDLHINDGTFFASFPLTPGHEPYGVVDEVGDGWHQIVYRWTVEVEGSDKPCCVAETVVRYYT